MNRQEPSTNNNAGNSKSKKVDDGIDMVSPPDGSKAASLVRAFESPRPEIPQAFKPSGAAITTATAGTIANARKRGGIPLTASMLRKNNIQWRIVAHPPHQMRHHWDFSTVENTPLTERMRILVLIIEAQLDHYGPELRKAFLKTRNSFQSNSLSMKKDFDKLCQMTIHKLHRLLDIVNRTEAFKAKKLIVNRIEAFKAKKLTNYMMNWLKRHWANPYPQNQDELQTMARECSATPKLVENWLFHAHQQKRMPAIQKARAMKRPSSMLMEDSLNILEGKPLRQLESGTSSSEGSSCERIRSSE